MSLTPEVVARLAQIKLLALDCDGVLTGNELIYDQHGDDAHVFNVRDGHGIRLLQRTGVKLALLTGRKSASVVRRVTELGFDHVREQVWKKGAALKQLCAEAGLPLEQVCYVGDDINDIGAVRLAGVGVAVADAVEELRSHADWVTTHAGGAGAVREVCEALLRAQGAWDGVVAEFVKDGD